MFTVGMIVSGGNGFRQSSGADSEAKSVCGLLSCYAKGDISMNHAKAAAQLVHNGRRNNPVVGRS